MANVALLALHRYFVWADRMERHYEERRVEYADERRAHWEPYMAYWYGGLYVVVEGWRDLKLSDPRIDDLLSAVDRVDLLRLYRNGAFHYQRSYFDERFVKFWAHDDAFIWVRQLHEAFRSWFERQPETKAS